MQEQFDVAIVDKVRETHDISSFRLERTDGQPLPKWQPGAHISLELPNGLTRDYSLCGERRAAQWTIGVQREEAGRGGSVYLHDALSVGDTLKTRSALNNFPLEEAPSYLFIAGGVGITPIVPMIEEAARRGASWNLVYVARSRDRMAFLRRLQQLDGDIDLWPTEERGRPDLAGLRASTGARTLVYACGPLPMLDLAKQHWEDNPDQLRVEHFSGDVGSDEGASFEVVLAQSNATLVIRPGRTILETIEEEIPGMSIFQSCLEGVCGSCETPVLEGEPDHRDLVLTKRQRERGDCMMICVSRSRSERLVLDL